MFAVNLLLLISLKTEERQKGFFTEWPGMQSVPVFRHNTTQQVRNIKYVLDTTNLFALGVATVIKNNRQLLFLNTKWPVPFSRNLWMD